MNTEEAEEEVPPVTDKDGDGILDEQDSCPDKKEDVDGWEDDDGCPDMDNDKDQVPDKKDACPNDPEDRDGFKDKDGCPDPDNDNDGYTEAQGDCDDDDDGIHPGIENDYCNDVDNDCDGLVDEDFPQDTYEAADPGGYDLGNYESEADIEVSSYFFPDDDIDLFYFYSDDGWFDDFGFTLIVSPPAGVDVLLGLYRKLGDADNTGGVWEFVDSVDSGVAEERRA